MSQSIASYFNKKPAEEKTTNTVINEASLGTPTSDMPENAVLGNNTTSDQEKKDGM